MERRESQLFLTLILLMMSIIFCQDHAYSKPGKYIVRVEPAYEVVIKAIAHLQVVVRERKSATSP